MGILLLVIGFIIMAIGGIMFLIVAFQESIPWGIGCILFSLVSLIFLIMHWEEAKKPFFIQLVGLPFIFLGAMLDGRMN